MEYLSRNIKIRKKDKSFDEIRIDWIDGMRLSFRFFKKDKPDEDIVINFTKEESEKIRKTLKEKINEEFIKRLKEEFPEKVRTINTDFIFDVWTIIDKLARENYARKN